MDKVLLVDFNNLWNRYYHAIVRNESDAENLDAFIIRFKHLMSLLDSSDYYARKILILDGTHSLESKKLIFPEYKGTRTAPKGTIYHLQNIFLREILLPVFTTLEVVQADKYEADHVISILACKFARTKEVYIYSNDKDLLQVPSFASNIFVGTTYTGGLVITPLTEEEILSKFKLTSLNQILKFRTFKGDSSDNISPAVPRLQTKAITDIIENCWVEDTLTEEVLNKIITYTNNKRVEENISNIKRNWDLMYLNPNLSLKEINLKQIKKL